MHVALLERDLSAKRRVSQDQHCPKTDRPSPHSGWAVDSGRRCQRARHSVVAHKRGLRRPFLPERQRRRSGSVRVVSGTPTQLLAWLHASCLPSQINCAGLCLGNYCASTAEGLCSCWWHSARMSSQVLRHACWMSVGLGLGFFWVCSTAAKSSTCLQFTLSPTHTVPGRRT